MRDTQTVFVTHLELTWRESAALMGVHSLGRAHLSNSGYHGWWSDPLNSRRFNNNYYVSILSKAWGPRAVNSEGTKNQWDQIDSGIDVTSDANEMMLNTDMCLAYIDVRAGPSAANGTCRCMWVMP